LALRADADPQSLLLNPSAFRAEPGKGSDPPNGTAPSFDCPDPNIQEIYDFRWRLFQKHLTKTPDGFVVTEFLPPVAWAGKYNTISCAAGHHFREGRWLHDPQYLDDYARFWFRKGGEPRRYSFWAADSVFAYYLVTGNVALLEDLLPDLVRSYQVWEKSHRDPGGLYWQIDDRDGMEYSLGGSGYRPTINAYQYGDASAIASAAEIVGRAGLANEYRRKAAEIKRLVQDRLWDAGAQFFKTLPRGDGKQLAEVREQIGFVPWYFNLPDPGYESAWKQMIDPDGFSAPFGPTTAERRHPRFMEKHDHDCLWNGPSWPYATTQT
jgi:glycogen debranching enzyme